MRVGYLYSCDVCQGNAVIAKSIEKRCCLSMSPSAGAHDTFRLC